MKLDDVVKFLNQNSGEHVEKIWIPSLKRDVLFKPLSTADVKTLLRTGSSGEFDISIELMKLSLFDKLIIETDTGISSKNITKIDYMSFLMGLRQILGNSIEFKFTCLHCQKEFNYFVDLENIFGDFLMNFDKDEQKAEYTYLDPKTKIEWHFELTNYTMMDYLMYRFYMSKLSELDKTNTDVIYGRSYIIPILYCHKIWFKVGEDTEQIDDWDKLEIQDKIEFFNKHIPTKIMLDIANNENKIQTLPELVKEKFDEYKMEKIVNDIVVTCPNMDCRKTFTGAFDLDSFFTF